MSRTLHPASPFNVPYDLPALCSVEPALQAYVYTTKRGEQSVRFEQPAAVRLLNQALLRHHFALRWYEVPATALCPAVPGRLDYLLYLQDFLCQLHGKKPKTKQFRLLDIGCGANLIYSLLAVQACRWQVVASDISATSLKHAQRIVDENQLQSRIELRLQTQPKSIFQGVISANDQFDLTVCNPPFHGSAAEAAQATARKQQNLGMAEQSNVLNFAGQDHELWCEGGEAEFLRRMIDESTLVANQVAWFSSLVSKEKNLPALQRHLTQLGCVAQQVIEMEQGNKLTRVLLWSWLTPAQLTLWRQYRW